MINICYCVSFTLPKQADSSKAECTGQNEGKDGENPNTGEDCTDAVILVERVVGENYAIPGCDQKTKRKTDTLHHTGNCEISSIRSKKPKVVHKTDEPKVQQAEFHVRSISKISVEGIAIIIKCSYIASIHTPLLFVTDN